MGTDALIETKDFTLPNGENVKLGALKEENFDHLTKWIRQQYMRNIREAISELPKAEQDSIMFKAASEAALMSSRTEDGLKVLYESVHGYARMCYELIQNTVLTFEGFDALIFRDKTDYMKGVEVLNNMFYAVYGEMFAENAELFFGDDKETAEEVKKVLKLMDDAKTKLSS